MSINISQGKSLQYPATPHSIFKGYWQDKYRMCLYSKQQGRWFDTTGSDKAFSYFDPI